MQLLELRRNVKAGLSSGLFAILLAISFASFIFTGHLAPYLPVGFGLAIVSTITLRIVLAKYSEISGIVPSPFVVICLFIAMMTKTISENLVQQGLQSQIFPTCMAVIVLSTLSAAVTMQALGYFRLGNFIRYIPYPVVSGILAGIGLSMILRGISVITGEVLTAHTMSGIFQWDIGMQMVMGVLCAFFIMKLDKLKFSGLVKTGFFVSLIAIFVVAYFYLSTPTSHAWFFGPVPSGRLWPPALAFSDLSLINWSEIAQQISLFGVMNFIFAIAYFVNVNGMEAFLKRDVDINRELKLTAVANYVTMAFGGIAGCLSITQTIPNILDGGTRYLSTIVATILTIAVLMLDASYLTFVPKALISGVPIYLGAIFVIEWGYKARYKLPLSDFILLLFILFVSVYFGFIYGAGLGIVLALALFIIDYSKTNFVKYAISGKACQSVSERSLAEQEMLKQKLDALYVIGLQGYLFFVTSHHLLQLIKTRVSDTKQATLKYLFFDCSGVFKLDSSTALVFSKIFELSKRHNFTIHIIQANDSVLRQLSGAGYNQKEARSHLFFADLGSALEWCENEIIAEHLSTKSESANSPIEEEMLSHFDTVKCLKGQYLIRSGTEANGLYFIQSGKVTAAFEDPQGREVKLLTAGKGAFVGDLSFFSGKLASHSFIADTDCTLYQITVGKLGELKTKDPQAVLAFYETLFQAVSERVALLHKFACNRFMPQ